VKRKSHDLPSGSGLFKGPIAFFTCVLVALQLVGMVGVASAQDATPGASPSASPVGEATELKLAEIPMAPITMLRNALGVDEGGSGVPIDRDAYAASVAFWDAHANWRG